MGNCSRKMKKNLNTWYYSNKNGALRIGSDMYCPKCNKHFGSHVTYNTVNHHLDTCLATQESTGSNSSLSVIQGMDLSQISFVVGGTTSSRQNEKYVWVKKVGPNNVTIWEKSVSKLTKNEGHLENMSIKSAKELSFEEKQLWFKLQNEKVRIPWTYGADHLNISENNLLETTRKSIRRVNLHKEVKIVFEEEKRVNDAGGLLREFVHLMCLELFSAERGLFIKTDTKEMIYRINTKIQDNFENIDLFKLLGKIIGKAVFEQMTIPTQLDRFILKQIVQQEFTLEDLATYDKGLYNSLKYIKENSIDDSDVFEEYFILNSPIDGHQIELVPNGEHIKITDANKEEFIRLKLNWLGKEFAKLKLESFFSGISQVIPLELFQVFSVEELEMILNGLPFIDVVDWEMNTNYKGSYYGNHQVVRWFWEAMHELDQEQLAKVFRFCTGSQRTPVEGFRALQSNRGELQKFTIESVRYSKEKASLSAHTCFNRLELPMYPKKEMVKEHLLNILNAEFTGVFGIE